jgi:hypothetical protein
MPFENNSKIFKFAVEILEKNIKNQTFSIQINYFSDKIKAYSFAFSQCLINNSKISDIYEITNDFDKINLYIDFVEKLQEIFELHENSANIRKLRNNCLENLVK